MEKGKNNRGVIIALVITIILLVVLCILFATNVISFSKKVDTTNSQTNNNTENIKTSYNEKQVLALGLSTYKYADGLETLFIKSADNTIINYNEVANFFTNSFIANAKKGNMCWPTEKNGNYYSNDDCAAGGSTKINYKSIKIKEYNDTKIAYTITLDVNRYSMGELTEHKEENQEFEIVLDNNIWKINKFTYNGTSVF